MKKAKKSKFNSINVEGIPQPIARGLETVVQMIRQQLPSLKRKHKVGLPVKHGTVIGSVRRRDIYGDSI